MSRKALRQGRAQRFGLTGRRPPSGVCFITNVSRAMMILISSQSSVMTLCFSDSLALFTTLNSKIAYSNCRCYYLTIN